MNRYLKRLLANRCVALSRQVTAERARRGGIVLGKDLRLGKSMPRTRYRKSILKAFVES